MDLFSNLKNFFKANATTIDNNIFRLHYRATSIILVAFSILVTARQYIGDPIDCMPRSEFPANLLDTFCWVHATFSLPDAWEKNVGVEVPYPGVDRYTPDKKRVYHSYYQWVCFVLFLQAILFYVPRYFWKAAERGRIKNLTLSLNLPVLSADTKEKNRQLLVDYLLAHHNTHRSYFLHYVFAEVLNFVNVVGQIYLMDAFLGKEFSTYGIKVVQFTNWDGSLRYDPMIKVFPRLTKCTFHNYGPSGDVQSHDTMCILPINIINEKIYIFLWFWFFILAILSGLVLIYRYLVIFWPKFRFLVTCARTTIVDRKQLSAVVDNCQVGDWFVLDLLSKNLDSLNFRDVIKDLAVRIDGKIVGNFYGAPA